MDTNSCDSQDNPISNLSLILRMDYPDVEVLDERKIPGGDGASFGSLKATGSIVFIADDEVISNRFWTADKAAETDVRQDCDTESTSCWQRHLEGDNGWKGNDAYFKALIYDMMEFDNDEMSTTVTSRPDQFNLVFDESRHISSSLSMPFTEAMGAIVLLTSDVVLKWLIILNLFALLSITCSTPALVIIINI